METLIIVVSIMLIAIVLLQSAKAEGASQSLGGGSSDLFNKRKERGGELFITRLTAVLGAVFMIVALIMTL